VRHCCLAAIQEAAELDTELKEATRASQSPLKSGLGNECLFPSKRRRLVEFKDGCRYGKFGKTKAYELIAQERIRAYKMGGKTLIDLDSIDEYHASLPRVESRAML
jgi:excisionase family DNA binding protein